MKKSGLARRLAKQKQISPAEAADQLDRVVAEIVAHLRQGKSVPVPGLGQFTPADRWSFRLDPDHEERKVRGEKP